MQKHLLYALAGITAGALAGTAVAADRETKTMRVPLADGSTVAIEYVGKVAPKVTVIPAERSSRRLSNGMFHGFVDFDRLIADMNRRTTEMMRRMDEMRRRGMVSGLPPVNMASSGSIPAGGSSISVVTVSNGSKGCTRTTEVVAQGAGSPPKVTSQVSGDCGPDINAEPTSVHRTGPTV